MDAPNMQYMSILMRAAHFALSWETQNTQKTLEVAALLLTDATMCGASQKTLNTADDKGLPF